MNNTVLMADVFVQLASILGTCWAVDLLLRHFGQTRVDADMVAGFLLGPFMFGLALPDVQRWLFPLTVDVPGAMPGDPTVTVTHPALTASSCWASSVWCSPCSWLACRSSHAGLPGTSAPRSRCR